MSQSNNKKSIFIVIIVALAIGAIALFATGRGDTGSSDDGRDDSEAEVVVRSTVEEFGTKLRNVSLLGPSDVVAREMDENYSLIVDAELFARWKADPRNAPGRLTSSPWPEGIQIESVTKNNDGSYSVAGYVNETTSEGEAPLASYPVTMRLEMLDGHWMIVEFEKGSYVPPQANMPGESVVIEGKVVCLPHRDTSGPQTLECAFGLQSDDGMYYSLRDADQAYRNVSGTQMNVPVEVTGRLTLREDDKYRSSGVIEVERIVEN